jgi:hypothetical protein
MLVIRLAGRVLSLLPNTSISYEINNPIFEADSLVGSFSYSFNLPLDDNNRQHFGFPEIVENTASLRRVFEDCDLEDEGQVLGRAGQLRLRTILPTSVKATVSFGLSALVKQLQRPLPGFNLGGVLTLPERVLYNGNELPGIVAHANTIMAAPDLAPYVFAPVMNEFLVEEERPYFTAFNKWLWSNQAVGAVQAGGAFSWNIPFTPPGGGDPINPPVEIAPFPRLPYVLESILQELGLATILALPAELRQLVLVHGVAMGGSFRLGWVLPNISVVEFLRRLRQALGLVVVISASGTATITTLASILADPTVAVDWSDKAASVMDDREVTDQAGQKLTYTVASGDEIAESHFASPPDLPVLPSVEYAEQLPLVYHLETNTGNQLRFVLDEGIYYQSKARPNTGTGEILLEWAPAGGVYPPLISVSEPGQQVNDQPQGIAATAVKTYDENNAEWYPGGTMHALFPAFVWDKIAGENTDVRLAFYRGMQPYYLFNHTYELFTPRPFYPLVTPFNKLATGATIGQYSLALHGPAGTYEMLLKGWLELTASAAPIKRKFYLSASDLAGLDTSRKIRVDGVHYLVVSVKLTVPITGPATVALLPC